MGNDRQDYNAALELVKFEGEIFWKIMSSFMLVNTIIIAFVGDSIIKETCCLFKEFKFIYFIAGLFGIVLSIAWLGTFKRNNNFYRFRIRQAREIEEIYKEKNKDFELLSGKGQDFAENKPVLIGKDVINYHNKGLAKFMEKKKLGYFVIVSFMVIYCIILICSLPLCRWLC